MKKLFAMLSTISFMACFFASVFSQILYIPKTVIAPTEKIIVTYSGFPGNSRDWISISAAGSQDGDYVAWQATGGNRSGTMTFEPLPYGNYELRGYYNNENIVMVR